MPEDKVTALTDVETLEVSLVKRGANQKRIAIAKTEELMADKDQDEIIRAASELPHDKDGEIDEILKAAKLSTKGARAVKSALKTLDAYQDEIPKGLVARLSKLLDFDEEEDEDEMKKSKVKKDGEVVELQTKLDALWKSNQEQVELLKKAEDRALEAEKAKADAETVLKTEREAAEFKALVEHCQKSFPFVTGSAEDKAKTLSALRTVAAEQATAVEASWLAANEHLSKSEIFKSAGSDIAAAAPVTAREKMDRKVQEIRAAQPNMTREQAVAHVVKTDKALSGEYLAERAQEN